MGKCVRLQRNGLAFAGDPVCDIDACTNVPAWQEYVRRKNRAFKPGDFEFLPLVFAAWTQRKILLDYDGVSRVNCPCPVPLPGNEDPMVPAGLCFCRYGDAVSGLQFGDLPGWVQCLVVAALPGRSKTPGHRLCLLDSGPGPDISFVSTRQRSFQHIYRKLFSNPSAFLLADGLPQAPGIYILFIWPGRDTFPAQAAGLGGNRGGVYHRHLRYLRSLEKEVILDAGLFYSVDHHPGSPGILLQRISQPDMAEYLALVSVCLAFSGAVVGNRPGSNEVPYHGFYGQPAAGSVCGRYLQLLHRPTIFTASTGGSLANRLR